MKRMLAGIVLALGMGAASAFAHHPFDAEFDWKRPVTITGAVTKFEWKAPHSMIEITGKDEKGAEAQWMVELGSQVELARMGWTSKQFKAGDRISVDGWLAKDGSKRVSAKSVTPSGGHELFAASSFFDLRRQSPQARGRGRGGEATATTGKDAP
jgi:uncharacterized protein DUF6152